jgi:hypothetical protein
MFDVYEGVYDVVSIDPAIVSFAHELDGCGIRVVYKRVGGNWTAWAVETRSVLLKSIGVPGLGLYAARKFKGPSNALSRMNARPGDVVGLYQEGSECIASHEDEREIRRIASDFVEQGKNKLTIVRPRGCSSFQLLDGDSPRGDAFPPYYSINDAINTGKRNNLELMETGVLRATRCVDSVDWEAGELSDWINSEFCYSYGKLYWESHGMIGLRERPILVE